MPRLTRSMSSSSATRGSLREDDGEDGENEEPMDDTEGDKRGKPHETVFDPSCNYKFVIAQRRAIEIDSWKGTQDVMSRVTAGDLDKTLIYPLRHPRSGMRALFAINSDPSHSVNEVLLVDDPHRSMFYGDAVVADGAIVLLAPVHPLFLVLPYIVKHANGRFIPLDDCLIDEDFPSITHLADNAQLLATISHIADAKEVCGITVFSYNPDKTLAWLEERFKRLMQALLDHGTLHQSIRGDDVVLRRYTFAILSDFLPPQIAARLRTHLNIPEIEVNARSATDGDDGAGGGGRKRKADDDDRDPIKIEAQKPKAPEFTIAQKRLQQASKGTKSLLGFFAKKTQ